MTSPRRPGRRRDARGPRSRPGGWSLAASSNTGGCTLPCASAGFHQHSEFSSRGGFDPSGTLYYNTHDSFETLNGSSAWSCDIRISTRKWFTGWSWAHGCA